MYKITSFQMEVTADGAQLQQVLKSLSKLRGKLSTTLGELDVKYREISDEVANLSLTGKHVCIELLDGKFDGMILDSQSGDPTERELVRLLRTSDSFERVQVVATENEAFVQLRPKSET
jgi:hypothetical protein